MRAIFSIILIWLIFVMSLAGWWLYFGITTLSNAASSGVPSELARHQRMLFTEGCVLLASLLVGGIALFYFSFRMYKEKSAKEMFFASFTHDLKTALFRLQLEVEKLSLGKQEKEFENILSHTRKMQLDLENGLDSTIGSNKNLFIEDVSVKNFLSELHTQWPDFHIKFSGEERIKVDRKALHSIFKNLLHNSFIHGEADEINIEVKKEGTRVLLSYSDNGKEFQGELEQLGKNTHYSLEGSGFGLSIVRQWVAKLNGKIEFLKSKSNSLMVIIQLPGRT